MRHRAFAAASLAASLSLASAACGPGAAVEPPGSSSASSTTGEGGGTGGSGGTTGVGGTAGSGGQGPSLPKGIYAVSGTELGSPTADLEPFGALVADTPLVGLGESIHTSGGFLALKARLIQYLIAEKGFRVLAMETPRTDAKQTAAYVASCQGTPSDALGGIFAVFASTDTSALIQWMCAWNQAHPADPVQFVGFDAQQPWNDLTELHDFLLAAAPADAAQLDAGLASCDGYGYPSEDAYYGSGAWKKPYPPGPFHDCKDGLDALDGYLASHAAALEAASSASALGWANVAALSLRSWQEEKFYNGINTKKSYEVRDRAMATILERSRELLFPGAKAVVWAHNYHLSERHDEVSTPGLGKTITTGTVLTEELGDAYKAFGIIGYDVGINWPGMTAQLPEEPSKTSLEAALHGLGEEALFVDLGSTTFLPEGMTYRVGHPSEETMVPAHQFHGVFYLEHSPGMESAL